MPSTLSLPTTHLKTSFAAVVAPPLVAVMVLTGLTGTRPEPVAERSATRAASTYGLWPASAVPPVPKDDDTRSVSLGLVISSSVRGTLRGMQYYAAGRNRGRSTGHVWSPRGRKLATVKFAKATENGWKSARFSTPVRIKPGVKYTVSYRARKGRYAVRTHAFGGKQRKVRKQLTAHAGTYTYERGRPAKTWRGSHYFIDVMFEPKAGAASTPTPTPTPTTTSTTAFPDASNTGVPSGVVLGPYGGGSTVSTPGTVIDAKQVDGGLHISAPDVVISRSSVNGNITVDPGASVTITDSVVDGGTYDGSAIGQYNITMRRVEVFGARQSVSCNENCDIQDSWLHAQYIEPGSDWHGDGFVSNGGRNMLLRHNTLACDSKPTGKGGACSAAVAAFGDFSAIANHTYDNNLFVSSPAGYCMYAGYDPAKPFGRQAANIVVTNNVFERGSSGTCGVFGPVSAVAPNGTNGNVFSGNVWDNGRPVRRP